MALKTGQRAVLNQQGRRESNAGQARAAERRAAEPVSPPLSDPGMERQRQQGEEAYMNRPVLTPTGSLNQHQLGEINAKTSAQTDDSTGLPALVEDYSNERYGEQNTSLPGSDYISWEWNGNSHNGYFRQHGRRIFDDAADEVHPAADSGEFEDTPLKPLLFGCGWMSPSGQIVEEPRARGFICVELDA